MLQTHAHMELISWAHTKSALRISEYKCALNRCSVIWTSVHTTTIYGLAASFNAGLVCECQISCEHHMSKSIPMSSRSHGTVRSTDDGLARLGGLGVCMQGFLRAHDVFMYETCRFSSHQSQARVQLRKCSRHELRVVVDLGSQRIGLQELPKLHSSASVGSHAVGLRLTYR